MVELGSNAVTEQDPRVAHAVAAFREAHAEDPQMYDGPRGPVPKSLLYHERLAHWVDALGDPPTLPLSLAAHCQHLRRWMKPRSEYPAGVVGYKKWRTNLALFHGDQAAEVLEQAGFEAPVIARVRELLLKKGLLRDPEVQRLEDAICLVFLELDYAPFCEKHDDAKVIDIVQKTWKKMTSTGHAAAQRLAAGLEGRPRDLLMKALSP